MLQSLLPKLTTLLIGLVLLVLLIFGAAASPASAAPPWLILALCHGAGLAVTLALAARLTPAAWWRRPTVRGIAVVTGGTWLCGSVLALATGCAIPATPAKSSTTATAIVPSTLVSVAPHLAPAVAPPGWPSTPAVFASAIAPFRVHRSLNLRAGPDVAAPRVAVIPAGAQLTPTGRRHGDWWQVHTDGGARQQTGWVSSLWLRQLAEGRH